MISLMEYCFENFSAWRGERGDWDSFETIIKKDENCFNIICKHLGLEKDGKVLNKSNTKRASHIFVTFLIGFGIGKKSRLLSEKSTFGIYDMDLWMYTSMLHDYGYFRKEQKEDFDLETARAGGDLLTDLYDDAELSCLNYYSYNYKEYCTYSYEEIGKYFEYKKDNYHRFSNSEKYDHGILGGCIAFKSYVKKNKKKSVAIGKEGLLLYKTACMIAAQHNIFKSSSEKYDSFYMDYGLTNLLSTSPARVDKTNPLLLLMSISDTLECCKRFNNQKNGGPYIKTSTILENTLIEVEEKYIKLDLTKLKSYILKKQNRLVNEFIKYEHSLQSIREWTSCDCVKEKDDVFVIYIK